MNKNVLFVDDESNVLDGIKRQLRKNFSITTALGPEEGLRVVRGDLSFAVIVSDMRMPGKDGSQFLKEVQEISPDSVRMMLTGNSDQQTAIDAVNRGNIFRFLNKPCDTETLISNIESGIRQYDLLCAEKELLEHTLRGSIKVLVDILALANPVAFSCAERIKYYVKKVAELKEFPDVWQYEVAAMLSQIGYITIPSNIMEKFFAGDELTASEQEMLSGHTTEACRLLENIPRLEKIVSMISQAETMDPVQLDNDPVIIGAQLLRAAKELDLLISTGKEWHGAVQHMRTQSYYNKEIITAFEVIEPPQVKQTIKLIHVNDLRMGMCLAEDVRSSSTLIVTKGQEVNSLMRRRLENFVQQKAIESEIRVYVNEMVFDQVDANE